MVERPDLNEVSNVTIAWWLRHGVSENMLQLWSAVIVIIFVIMFRA
jgi:hypothetical protein